MPSSKDSLPTFQPGDAVLVNYVDGRGLATVFAGQIIAQVSGVSPGPDAVWRCTLGGMGMTFLIAEGDISASPDPQVNPQGKPAASQGA